LPAAAVAGEPVTSVSLQSFLEREELGSVDLFKMDIEGSEYEVLLNTPAAAARRVRRL